MKKKDFIIVERWMGQLGLTSTELLIYATIYGFTQNENGKFTAHLRFFKDRFGISRTAAINALNHLVKLNLIEKKQSEYKGRYSGCIIYTANKPENIQDTKEMYSLTSTETVPSQYGNSTPTSTETVPSQYGNSTPTSTETVPPQYGNSTPTSTETVPLPYGNDTSITYITYKDNIEEYNIEDNISITPNGGNSESDYDNYESDIDERELSIDDGDNAQCEISFAVNDADNTAEDNKSTGSKKKVGSKSKKAQDAQINARFEKFWAAYPRHIDKAKALKAFTKINPGDELLEQMINNINEAKKTTQWQTQQYIPYPTTWLNGSRWEDEIAPDNTDYEITGTDRFDNPYDRAVANGENPFASDDWPW